MKGDAENQKERKESVKNKVESVKLYASARKARADARLGVLIDIITRPGSDPG